MSETTVSAKIPIEIPYGLFEYTAKFKEPIIEAWEDRSKIVATVLTALKPWGFALDGVEVKSHGEKLGEHGIIFRRTNPPSPPSPARSIAVSLGTIFISAANVDWTEADDLAAAMSAGITAIREFARPQIESQHVALGMHIQLKASSVKDVTAPLLSGLATQLLDGEIKTAGVILTREQSSLVIDTSAAYANALFVRLFRQHSGQTSLQQIAEILRRDENSLLETLGLEGDR
jgi:hypothetical protein